MAAVMHLFISHELREHFDFFFFYYPTKDRNRDGINIPPIGPTPLALSLNHHQGLHLSLQESRILIGECARRSAWSGRSW